MYRNRAVFSTAAACRAYAGLSGLFPAEQAALALCDTEGATLDLGVGGGRTAAALAQGARRYVGVDYAPRMVARCAARFAHLPHAGFLHADAADLPTLAGGAFDLVLFSYNGIDYVSHAHRLRILAEVRRLLAPSGRFVFSTHNRASAALARRPRRPRRPRGWARAAIEWANWLRLRPALRQGPGHALINDDAHLFALVTYAIARNDQLRQLADAGFQPVAVLAPDGTMATNGDDGAAPAFHFVASRAP